MVGVAEIARRARTTWSDRLHSLPILALSVHSACNCRCVMCDIWKANREKREISLDDLERHVADIRRLHVQRVMLTGGEPLLHSNLWALCDRLQEFGIRITLVTTGLLLTPHAASIARSIDEVVVSIDGPPDIHDGIRRVRGGFERIARGVQSLRDRSSSVAIIARSVVQRANYAHVSRTIETTASLPVDCVSFLAADVTSPAFNRPDGWDAERQAEVALSAEEIGPFAEEIANVRQRCVGPLSRGFVKGGLASLQRIHDYYAAHNGLRRFPAVRCNAPWTSAVLEPDGRVRPCFFHAPYGSTNGTSVAAVLNSDEAVAFRRSLAVGVNATCERCVCSLSLPYWASP